MFYILRRYVLLSLVVLLFLIPRVPAFIGVFSWPICNECQHFMQELPTLKGHPEKAVEAFQKLCKVIPTVAPMYDSEACDLAGAHYMQVIDPFLEDGLIDFVNICRGYRACEPYRRGGFAINGTPIADALMSAPERRFARLLRMEGKTEITLTHSKAEAERKRLQSRQASPHEVGAAAADTYLILHLTDLHYDAEYAVNATNDCYKFICCREIYGPGEDNLTRAGIWGDYKCDLNSRMLFSLTDHLVSTFKNETKQLAAIYITGDNPPHDITVGDVAFEAQRSLYLYNLIKEKMNMPVLPSIGNHDFSPSAMQGVRYSNSTELLKMLAQNMTFLGAEAQATFEKGGYYAKRLENGLNVISLNMEYCDNLNLFNYQTSVWKSDPNSQLQWLADTLGAVEARKEYAHVLGHIPPGTQYCLSHYSLRLKAILERYEHTVSALFFGHTHNDAFHVLKDEDERAFGVAYVAPSVTTYEQQNPAYRLYEVDATTHAVVNHFTYTVNLTKWNLEPDATDEMWRLEYEAKSAYDLEDLSPTSWLKVAKALKSNATLFEAYYARLFAGAPLDSPLFYCGYGCRIWLHCEAMATTFLELWACVKANDPVPPAPP